MPESVAHGESIGAQEYLENTKKCLLTESVRIQGARRIGVERMAWVGCAAHYIISRCALRPLDIIELPME